MEHIGSLSLLDQHSVGFLCSRTTASSAILPCLDWATEMANGSVPVMSTFHSDLESAVLDILLRGSCPIILVLGRSMYKVMPKQLVEAFDSGRLLIVSISQKSRISRESAFLCNRYIAETASMLTFGFLSKQSSLYPLYEEIISKGFQYKILAKCCPSVNSNI